MSARPLDYALRSARRPKGMNYWSTFRRGWLWTAAVFAAVMLVPFAVVGETWGMVWLNVPLSAWVEDRWGIGSDSAVLVLCVTLANAPLVATVLTAVGMTMRHAARRPRRPY